MRGEEDGLVLAAGAAHEVAEAVPRGGVEARAGLVEEEDLGVVREAAREGEALAQASGEGACALAAALDERDVLEDGLRAVRDGGAGHAVEAREEAEVLFHGQLGVRALALGDEADDAAEARFVAGDAEARDLGRAARGAEDAGEDVEEGGLARAVGAQEGDDLAGGHVQRDALERVPLAVVAREVPGAEHSAGKRVGSLQRVATRRGKHPFAGAPNPGPVPSLLVKDAVLLTQDDARRVLRGDLRAEDGVITHVGGDVPQHADEVVEAGGDLLLPGLVNAHTHSPMTLLRGLGDDLPLETWLRDRIWPTERRLARADVERGVDLAILEMLRTGTTCFNDMYFFAEAAAQRAARAGIRALVASTFFNWDTMEMPVERMEENSAAFVRAWQGHPLVTPTLGPHATYTCDDEKLAAVRRVQEATGARVHTHCSETRFEVQDVLAKRGARPVEVLRRHGLLRGSILAHCGWVTKEEVRALAAEGAHVAHCPVSNLKLATGGVMPWDEMHEAGVNVALGTDGAASNNTLDVLETAKYAALVQKQHRWDPRAAPAQQVLDAATRGGARACGVGPGMLAVGAPCDLALVSTAGPHLATLHDPVSDVVYAAHGSDVRMTVVAGRVLYLDGAFRTLDAAGVVRGARESAKRVRKAAGL